MRLRLTFVGNRDASVSREAQGAWHWSLVAEVSQVVVFGTARLMTRSATRGPRLLAQV